MAEERQQSKVFARNLEADGNFKTCYEELVEKAKPIELPLIDLPFVKNTQFTGREEQLANISDYLSKQNTLAITNSVTTMLAQAIAGLGGVGKSQLAIEYAYRAIKKKTYQIVWFINGQNLDADYLRLAAQLKIYGDNKNDVLERTKRKLQELGNYLLIIDDAENHEAIKNYLPQTGKNAHILITTRYRSEWPKMLELGVFTLDEALEYFKKIIAFKAEELVDVIKLAEKLLGLLPLALTQAGAFIKQTGVSIKEYINFFETKLEELWGTEDAVQDYSQTIAVTWEITIKRVKQQYPKAEKLLRGMSCLASTPNLIDQSWLADLVIDEQIRVASLGQLADYSMIDRHRTQNNFLVHSLVQEVVQAKISFKKKLTYFQQVYKKLKTIYPYAENRQQITDFAEQRLLLPHLEALLKLVEKHLKLLQEDDPVINYGAITSIEKELVFGLLTLIPDGDENLGNALKQQMFLERSLPLIKKYCGNEHVEMGMTLMSLGNAYGVLGCAAKQQEFLEKALFIYKKHYHPAHPLIAKLFINLGNAYGDLDKILQKKALLENALTIFEERQDQAGIAITLTNLGQTYGDLGFEMQHKTFLNRALVIKEKLYGLDHPEVGKTLVGLSHAYYSGLREDALKQKALLERALLILEKHYGSDHPEVAIILASMGAAYSVLGDLNQCTVLKKRALAIEEKHYGANHPEVAITLGNLANDYLRLGQFDQVKRTVERAYQILLHHPDMGPTHAQTKIIHEKLVSINGILADPLAFKKDLFSDSNLFKIASAKTTELMYGESLSILEVEKKLRNAANKNDTTLLARLIKENPKININAQDAGECRRCALHWAVIKEHHDCIKMLLAAGADSHLLDGFKKSAIHYASLSSDLDVQQIFAKNTSHSRLDKDNLLTECLDQINKDELLDECLQQIEENAMLEEALQQTAVGVNINYISSSLR